MKIKKSATNSTALSETITTGSGNNKNEKVKQTTPSNSVLLDRTIEDATTGLRPQFSRDLHSISGDNALVIANYILAMRNEINLSDTYRWNNISVLCKFSKYHKNKPFTVINRDDILTFLNNLRKPEISDPLHKWIGTYNQYRIQLLRFFKWLYYPNIEPDKRPKPKIMENIQQLKRKEKSIYKPTDLWTTEDDLLFLKYCPSKRNKCFHVMAYDTGCRPHELLKLRLRDIVFKNRGDRQYAEVLVNGKTGSRHIPLIDSIPHIKDYLDHEHPQLGNPNAILICGIGKSLGRALDIRSLHKIYNKDYKKSLFQKLLDNPNVPLEDKHKIRELLKKPWNPYIRDALSTWNTICN
ncbi:MAG: hypothetical protein WA421_03140 [Nitrososphaeraceae archaeon]